MPKNRRPPTRLPVKERSENRNGAPGSVSIKYNQRNRENQMFLIGQDAEERYSREVVAHAESIKQIETLKNELAGARAVLRDQTSIAETALAKLVSSEGIWLQQRESLNKEISDLDKRFVLF